MIFLKIIENTPFGSKILFLSPRLFEEKERGDMVIGAVRPSVRVKFLKCAYA
mgnify:CR=1 FL=1